MPVEGQYMESTVDSDYITTIHVRRDTGGLTQAPYSVHYKVDLSLIIHPVSLIDPKYGVRIISAVYII